MRGTAATTLIVCAVAAVCAAGAPGAEAPGLQRDGVAVSADATRVVTPPGWVFAEQTLGARRSDRTKTDAQANDVGVGMGPNPVRRADGEPEHRSSGVRSGFAERTPAPAVAATTARRPPVGGPAWVTPRRGSPRADAPAVVASFASSRRGPQRAPRVGVATVGRSGGRTRAESGAPQDAPPPRFRFVNVAQQAGITRPLLAGRPGKDHLLASLGLFDELREFRLRFVNSHVQIAPDRNLAT